MLTVYAQLLSHVWFFVAPWMVAHQAPMSIHGILQTRILEWVAIPFSRGSFWPSDWTPFSCIADRFFYHLGQQGSSTDLC